jgi:hypothetical protein
MVSNEMHATMPIPPSKFHPGVVPTNPIVEPPSLGEGLYTSAVKDPGQIKSPALPNGENVAVATGVTAVS